MTDRPLETLTPQATKRWERPILSRIDTSDAENSANPIGTDAVITQGS